jgi:dihydrodipicolinate synthase/N-acetylneuraminate lyase
VGVHTTQFAIRDPKHGLFRPVLELANETVDECSRALGRTIIKIGGICGATSQAVAEAEFIRSVGFHVGLLSLGALKDADVDALIAHCKAVAEVVPIIGFYLQPAVGGRVLPAAFWRRFAEIEEVIAIKIAPFNRYQTFDVVRGVAEAGRAGDIALYTGNDDNIVLDLLTTYRVRVNGQPVPVRIAGGLLGHWAFWTQGAVQLLDECHRAAESADGIPHELLTRAVEVTDVNAAAFDAANAFAGCIAGIHEILMRQGLMAGRWTLDPAEDLSLGQKEELDRVYAAYPHLNDDAFVDAHLDKWLR